MENGPYSLIVKFAGMGIHVKILLFGTGKVYQRYKHLFFGHEIIYLLDNDVNKQGDILDGIEIVSPDKGINVPYEAVFILSVLWGIVTTATGFVNRAG